MAANGAGHALEWTSYACRQSQCRQANSCAAGGSGTIASRPNDSAVMRANLHSSRRSSKSFLQANNDFSLPRRSSRAGCGTHSGTPAVKKVSPIKKARCTHRAFSASHCSASLSPAWLSASGDDDPACSFAASTSAARTAVAVRHAASAHEHLPPAAPSGVLR